MCLSSVPACSPATPKYRVVQLSDPCAAAGEQWCYALQRCSTGLQCVALTFAASAVSAAATAADATAVTPR